MTFKAAAYDFAVKPMPVIYTIDRSERVVYLSTVGDPSFDEWRDALLGVFSDPAFETGFHFISGHRRGEPPGVKFAERQLVFIREHEREIGRCRWAAVVPDPATDEVARMVASRAGMNEVEVGYFYYPAAARTRKKSGRAPSGARPLFLCAGRRATTADPCRACLRRWPRRRSTRRCRRSGCCRTSSPCRRCRSRC